MTETLHHLGIAIIFCLLTTTQIFAEEIEVEVWVNDTHPPYTYEENGEVKGIYIEVMKRISKRMGYKMKFNPAPWQRVKKEIEIGRAFSFVPPYYHGYDWLYVWPYSLPIMVESVVVICQKEILKNPRPNWPEDYLGLVIANNTGYDGFGGPKFRQYVSEGKIALQEVKSTRQNILMLLQGRADCYMVNRLSYAWEIKKLTESGKINVDDKLKIKESLVISSDAVYMGFTDRDKGEFYFKRDFHQKFNNELYKMYKSNEIQQIAENYMK